MSKWFKDKVKYRVVDVYGHNFKLGDIVILDWDDGSLCPRFVRLSDGETQYLNEDNVEIHNPICLGGE